MADTRRICLALDLKNDAALIAEYESYHEPQNAWPEITQSIRDAGVEEMQIYRLENRLFMIMEVNDSFDPAAKAVADAANPKVQEWEQLMWKFQQPLASARPGEKWLEMKEIYRLSAVDEN
jgi:L-rhamnose mutarotase